MMVTGKALMSIKASFSNVANVLLDWDEVHNDDFCSWRGVSCGNLTMSVVALYVSLSPFLDSLNLVSWFSC